MMAGLHDSPKFQTDTPIVVELSEFSTRGSADSSNLTSSDKLTALPSTRNRTPTQRPSHSLPSLFSSSPQLGSKDLTPIASQKTSASDGSVGKDTTKPKVSFDSDRISLPSFQNVRQAISSLHRHSDPTSGPSRQNDHSPLKDIVVDGPSHSNSRANSPLRLFPWTIHRGHSREEPFIPIDPFKWKLRLKSLSGSARFDSRTSQDRVRGDDEGHEWCEYDCAEVFPSHCCLPPPATCSSPTISGLRNFLSILLGFITEVFPRQLYLYFLLRLPSLYFSRVARIFEDAEVSKPDIQRMIDACGNETNDNASGDRAMGSWAADNGPAMATGNVSSTGVLLSTTGQLPAFSEDWSPPAVSPALARFKNSWEAFIDSLLREWKTLNIVSALLLSAILTMFQIPSAASDPLVRTAALLSLICALKSLTFGCIYIVRFGTMRSMYKASRWAEEARKTNTRIFWNVWVLLAMPAIWLAWSMLLFVTSILSFVWRTGASDDPEQRLPLARKDALGPRIAITGVFVLGIVYLVFIVRTLRSYGGPRKRASLWRVGSGNNGGVVGGGMGTAGQSGDGEARRGRERERGPKNNFGRGQRKGEMDDDNEREGESGKERGRSGLRKAWGENESSNEIQVEEKGEVSVHVV